MRCLEERRGLGVRPELGNGGVGCDVVAEHRELSDERGELDVGDRELRADHVVRRLAEELRFEEGEVARQFRQSHLPDMGIGRHLEVVRLDDELQQGVEAGEPRLEAHLIVGVIDAGEALRIVNRIEIRSLP